MPKKADTNTTTGGMRPNSQDGEIPEGASPTTGRMRPNSQDGEIPEGASPTTGRMRPNSQDGAVLEGANSLELWKGRFGDEYTTRNLVDHKQRIPFFRYVLGLASGVKTICELGANKGHNLEAFRAISSDLSLTGVEVNPQAFKVLSTLENVAAVRSSIQDFSPVSTFDLVFTCGVLIHVPPADLNEVYNRIFGLSDRYILLNEYFSPSPVEIPYRGTSGTLFKRDFGTEFLEGREDKLEIVDYGFLWKRAHPAWDNTTWWLFEKRMDASGQIPDSSSRKR